MSTTKYMPTPLDDASDRRATPCDHVLERHTEPFRKHTDFLLRRLACSSAFVFFKSDLVGASNIKPDTTSQDPALSTQCLARMLSGHVAEMGFQLVVNDMVYHPLLQQTGFDRQPAFGAFVGTPIRDTAGTLRGVFCAIDKKLRNWTDGDVSFLSQVAMETGLGWDFYTKVATPSDLGVLQPKFG